MSRVSDRREAEKRAVTAMACWLLFAVAAIVDAAITIGWAGAAFAFAASIGAFFAGLVAIPSDPKDAER